MIRHHPDTNLIVEYANGSLPWAVSIAVSAHIALCTSCRQQYSSLNALGGASLAFSPSSDVSEDAFDSLMSKIGLSDSADMTNMSPLVSQRSDTEEDLRKRSKRCRVPESLPSVVKKLLPESKLNWKWVSTGLKSAVLKAGQSDYEVAFHKISKGNKVVEHDHRGTEYTLVLEGSFSDERGVYRCGDFVVNQPGDIHRPTATLNQDCLCLSICEAPVVVTGFIGKVVNPFLRVNPQ